MDLMNETTLTLTSKTGAQREAGATITLYAGKSRFAQLRGILRDIRPIWLMEELGEPYDIKWIAFADDDHKSAEYRAINPFCRVPAIRAGALTLFESAAVCTYLADRFQRFVPNVGTTQRALFDQWLFVAMSTFEPHTGAIFTCDHMRDQNEATAVARARAVEALQPLLAALDGVLEGRDALLDDGFSVADIILSCVLRFVRHSELLSPHQNVARYLARNFARTGFQKAFLISNNG